MQNKYIQAFEVLNLLESTAFPINHPLLIGLFYTKFNGLKMKTQSNTTKLHKKINLILLYCFHTV